MARKKKELPSHSPFLPKKESEMREDVYGKVENHLHLHAHYEGIITPTAPLVEEKKVGVWGVLLLLYVVGLLIYGVA